MLRRLTRTAASLMWNRCECARLCVFVSVSVPVPVAVAVSVYACVHMRARARVLVPERMMRPAPQVTPALVQAFFQRWWRQQTPDVQALWRGFVSSGQVRGRCLGPRLLSGAVRQRRWEALLTRVYFCACSAPQVEFANGGWCMHDEGATHFTSMIDQVRSAHAARACSRACVSRVGVVVVVVVVFSRARRVRAPAFTCRPRWGTAS